MVEGIDALLQHTVGRWQPSPLWVLRGKMFSWPEKLLLLAMLDMWHSACRPSWWYASNSTLMRLADLSKPTFLKARRQLVSKLLVQYRSGHRNHVASTYHLSQEFLYTLTQHNTLTPKDKNLSSGNVGDQFTSRLGNYAT